MPYINKEDREKYDPVIDILCHDLNGLKDNDKIAGELNYVLFRLAKSLCSYECGGRRNYARMAVVSSALSEAQAEFRRRIMAPYEDEKIEIAGDVEILGKP